MNLMNYAYIIDYHNHFIFSVFVVEVITSLAHSLELDSKFYFDSR